MRATLLFALVIGLAPVSIHADDPQPLGCDDWVFLEPGLACQVEVPFTSRKDPNEPIKSPAFRMTGPVAVDSLGSRLLVEFETLPEPCGMYSTHRLRLLRVSGTTTTLLGYVDGKCIRPDAVNEIGLVSGDAFFTLDENYLTFDDKNGRLLIHHIVRCLDGAAVPSLCPEAPFVGEWVAAIAGFTTEFEILHSFVPVADVLGFRVPAFPEGFPAADSFDTYYGDLATVGDWSQAQSLQCGYPASPPNVGAYIEINDPLPNPDPGHGRYYVTAVHYQGQTRYGRKRIGGVLSGRDPAVLPVCQ